MKTVSKTINKSNLNLHSSKPFFNRSGEGYFFSQSKETESPLFTPAIQKKLAIGQPGDKYELEADSMAEKVVQNTISSKSPDQIQKVSEFSNKEEELQNFEEDKETNLQRKSIFESEDQAKNGFIQRKVSDEADPLIETQLQSSRGSGQSLDAKTKNDMEQSFGTNFGNVNIHTGSNAVQMNQKLGAKAFTTGNDIYFNQGNYNPSVKDGKRLLAHELTHVMQQNPYKTTNNNPAVYRKKINEFQQANSAEIISASQKQIVEPQKTVDVKQRDTSQSLRRCIAGCNSPSPDAPQTFTAGDTLAVNTPNHDGWIQGRLGNTATSDIESFPDYLKVEYIERRDNRDFFTIKEGAYNGRTGSLAPGYLASGRTWGGPARVLFNEDRSRSTPLQKQGTLDYGGGTANAKIFVSGVTPMITANSNYPLKLPDSPHSGGRSYGDYAMTWFRIIGGPQGDEYLHRGRTSAGCVTVTSDVWPQIYHNLINKRDGNQHIGTIKRVVV